MAIKTTKATIQMRRGLEQDFDAEQMAAGEWAVSTDKKYVRMCFAPGLCFRMATYESFEEDMEEIRQILKTCQDIQVAVDAMAKLAEQHKDKAATSEANAKISETNAGISETHAIESATTATQMAADAAENANAAARSQKIAATSAGNAKDHERGAKEAAAEAAESAIKGESFAHGKTGTRPGEDTDNAKFYYEQTKAASEQIFVERTRYNYTIYSAVIEDTYYPQITIYDPVLGSSSIVPSEDNYIYLNDILASSIETTFPSSFFDYQENIEIINEPMNSTWSEFTIPHANVSNGIKDKAIKGETVNLVGLCIYKYFDEYYMSFPNEVPLTYITNNVKSVNGQTGDVIIPIPTKTSELENDSNFASTVSPEFTGTPKAPTPTANTNNEQIATTAFVKTAVTNHNSSSAAHDDIRSLITSLTTRLNALADSDDTTLDQLSEIVAYIKSNRSLIDNITTSKVSVSDIVDNLTSTATNKPLSANQGKVLKDLITALTSSVDEKVDKVAGKGLSTNDYTTADKDKLAGISPGANANVQADWNTTDTNSDAYIKNKPTIPTINNGTLTIQKNGVTVQTFSANQADNATANIVVPTKTSELENDSGFGTGGGASSSVRGLREELLFVGNKTYPYQGEELGSSSNFEVAHKNLPSGQNAIGFLVQGSCFGGSGEFSTFVPVAGIRESANNLRRPVVTPVLLINNGSVGIALFYTEMEEGGAIYLYIGEPSNLPFYTKYITLTANGTAWNSMRGVTIDIKRVVIVYADTLISDYGHN